MYLVKSIIDIFVVLLLLRLLIRSNEAYFDPIYGLIFKITDPVLIPARTVVREASKGVLLTLLGLVVLRGFVYLAVGLSSVVSAMAVSFLNLFQLLFQAYMVMWFVSVLSQRSAFGTSFINLIQRAFTPLNQAAARFGMQRRHFYPFAFLFLWIIYALLSAMIRFVTAPQAVVLPMIILNGFVEGLILVLGLFPFPGFFSLIIIVGALLSWVSPDPSNPVVQAVYGISEPLLRPFRRFVPLIGGLDLSPIVALFCFQILGGVGRQIIARLLSSL